MGEGTLELNSTAGVGYIAHISDIHFDPFYDPTLLVQLINKEAADWEGVFETSTIKSYGTVGSDSNYNLLKSFLDALLQYELYFATRRDEGQFANVSMHYCLLDAHGI